MYYENEVLDRYPTKLETQKSINYMYIQYGIIWNVPYVETSIETNNKANNVFNIDESDIDGGNGCVTICAFSVFYFLLKI